MYAFTIKASWILNALSMFTRSNLQKTLMGLREGPENVSETKIRLTTEISVLLFQILGTIPETQVSAKNPESCIQGQSGK